jgi:glycosyltransferase involved in cell wall biosynthesis
MSTPCVSIVMPTRNRPELAARAVDSVIAQTLTDWELIIVDDASTDGTPDTIARYTSADSRIRGLRMDCARGAPSARNRGIGAARADLVAFIDDDDEWLDRKLQRQVETLAVASAGTGVSHAAFLQSDAAGSERVAGEFMAPDGHALDDLVRGNRLANSTVMARRTVLDAAGRFDESLPRLQDWDLWIRLAAITRFVCVPEPLARIHQTPRSISTDITALRTACALMAGKFGRTNLLSRRQYAELCYALAMLLGRNHLHADARRLVARSLRLRPWPPARIAGGVLLLAGMRPYLAAADLWTRAFDRRAR